MSAPTRFPPLAYLAIGLLVAGGGYWLGTRRSTPPAADEGDVPDARAPTTRASDTPARLGEIDVARSVHHVLARAQGADRPDVGGTLLSERDDECTESCPTGLHVRATAADVAERSRHLASLAPELDALEGAAVAVPAFAATLHAVRASQAGWIAQPPAPPPAGRTRRLFSLGMRRAEYGWGAEMVVLVAYDHCDPFFDAKRGLDCAPGGGHLMVARIERRERPDAAPALVAGLVEVEEKPLEGGAEVGADNRSADVMNIVAPVYMHFAGRRGAVHGLYLAPDGSVHTFGADRIPHRVASPGPLTAALTALIKRA